MTRVEPPYASDEKTMLVAFLDYFRETIIAQLDGLSDEQVRVTPTPTANSLLGILNHLVYVEHWWFYECLLGNEPTLPDVFGDDEDADFKPPLSQSVGDTVALYRAEFARSNSITAAASLDDVAKHERGASKGITLRWILVHLIEETARHAGHADITRELIDGKTGV